MEVIALTVSSTKQTKVSLNTENVQWQLTNMLVDLVGVSLIELLNKNLKIPKMKGPLGGPFFIPDFLLSISQNFL